MILVDANIPLYAEDETSPHHDQVKSWWVAQLSGSAPVCLCWTVIGAYIRISTNTRVFSQPLSLDQALSRVDSWFAQPCTRILRPSQRHWQVFQEILREGQAVGNLVTDAHLAALAIEHGCILASCDADFARFRGLKWINPLVP